MRKIFLFSFICVFGLYLSGVEIVKDGRPMASIVLSEAPSPVEQFAAEEFITYVEKLTGATLSQSSKPLPGLSSIRYRLTSDAEIIADPALAAALTTLDKWGFVIRANDAGVTVIAKQEQAIHYGNYHLLRSYGGIYWLHPDEPEAFTPTKNFSVPTQISVKNPYFKDITLGGNSIWAPCHRILWRIRNGASIITIPEKSLASTKRHDLSDLYKKLGYRYAAGGHCFTPLLVGSWSHAEALKLAETNPEYFGLRDGKRVVSDLSLKNPEQLCQPCLSNPEVLDRIASNLQKEIRTSFPANAELRYRIYNDDHTHWCECENCRVLDDPKAGPNGKNSNRYWALMNYLAAKLLPDNPNLELCAIAYQDYRDVPTKIHPDRRVSVQVAPHGDCYVHQLDDAKCPLNPTYKKMFADWCATGVTIYSFEYHNQLPGASRYIPIERSWVNFLKYYHQHGIDSAISVVCDGSTPHYSNHYLQSYNYVNSWYSRWQQAYLNCHFAWNINDDFTPIWEKINSLYYAAAWAQIKPYRLLLEKAVADSAVCMSYGSSAGSTLGKCYELPGVAEQADKYLQAALEAVESQPLYLKRVAREREYFQKNWAEAGFSSIGKSTQIHTLSKLSAPLVLDGKLDEADWIKATAFSNFIVAARASSQKSSSADFTSKLKILYDYDNIYFGFEAGKVNGQVADIASADGLGALKGTHIELLLMSEQLQGKYYHIGFSRNGHTYSALSVDGKTRDLQRPLPFEYKIVDEQDYWTAELRIPASQLGGIQDGLLWKFNAMHSAPGKDGRNQNASLVESGFHDTTALPVIAFGEGGSLIQNGNFTDLAEREPPKAPKNKPNHVWIFEGPVPTVWNFINMGIASMHKDEDNRPYLKISTNENGHYPIIWQELRLTDPTVKTYIITIEGRNGVSCQPSIYYQRNSKKLASEAQFANGPEWKTMTFRFDVSQLPPGPRSLFILFYKGMEIRSITALPVVEATLPDAAQF